MLLKNKLKLLFKIKDLPFIILLLISIILCILGFLKGKPVNINDSVLIVKLISLLSGMIFFTIGFLFYLLRWQYIKNVSYVTNHGLVVFVGRKNNPSQNDVEIWTHNTITLLAKEFNISFEQILKNVVKGIHVKFSDYLVVSMTERTSLGEVIVNYVKGFSTRNYIEVGSPNPSDCKNKAQYISSLFRHELSHPILAYLDPIYNNINEAHEKMKSL